MDFFGFGMVLVLTVAAISVVDFRSYRIPDALTATLATAGLGFHALAFGGQSTAAQLIAAVILGVVVWALRELHLRISGRVGLGLGDVKMIGACAIWISPWAFSTFLLVASGSGLLFLLTRNSWRRQLHSAQPIPFGPFLGFGLVTTWLVENQAMIYFTGSK